MNWLTGKKSVATVNALEETTREGINKAYIPKFLYKPPYGYPRFTNITYVRYLATTPYVEMCIKTIIDEIAAIEWDVVPMKGMEDQADEVEINNIKNLFENPNTNKESFEQVFIRMPVRDMLEVNTGILNKVFNMKEELVEIVARDGGSFTKNPDVHGMYTTRDDIILPNNIVADSVAQEYLNPWTEITSANARERSAYFQYGWIAGPMPIPFGKRELIWIEGMKRTDDHYGFSPVQILQKNLQMLIYMVESDLEYYNDNNVPKGIIGLDDSDAEEIEAFKDQWFETQRKQDEFGNWKKIMNKVPIVNKTPNFTRIEFSASEMQVIEKQKWYTKMVWASFGVTATELGYTEDAQGSANQIVQSKVFRKKAINPVLRNLEARFNQEIVSEFNYWGNVTSKAGQEIKKPKYEFLFKKFDVDEERQKAELYKIQLETFRTVNEVRRDEGLDPVEGGDEAPVPGTKPSNSISFNGMDGNNNQGPDGSGPYGAGEGPGNGQANGSGKEPSQNQNPEGDKRNGAQAGEKSIAALKDIELKYKYVKRTGNAGHYKYWYNDPKTGSLVEGNKPTEKISDEENKIKKKIDKSQTTESVLKPNEKIANGFDIFDSTAEVSNLKNRLYDQAKKTGYLKFYHGSSSDNLFQNYERKKGDVLKDRETYGNGLYLATDKDYSITKRAEHKYEVPVSKEQIKNLLPVESFEMSQVTAAKSFLSGNGDFSEGMKEIFKKRAMNRFGYSEKQVNKDIKWLDERKEKISKLDTNNPIKLTQTVMSDDDEYWREYDFPSSIFEAGLTMKGYTGVLDMQKNVTIIEPEKDILKHSTEIKKHEGKAMSSSPADNPLILNENERPTGYSKLQKAIEYVLSQNEKAIIELLQKEMQPSVLNQIKSDSKAFGDLIDKIKSILGIGMLKQITAEIIKNNYMEGWDEAEKNLNINIVPDPNAINFITDYTFDNIKGMNDDIAERLRQTMQRAVMDGSPMEQVKADIKKAFDVGDNRAEMIARTESNRAANFGRLHGYQKSGVPGTKVYSAHIDDRTSDLCKRLNGQEVELNELFKDPQGKWDGMVPPAHVNCRSSWIFKITE